MSAGIGPLDSKCRTGTGSADHDLTKEVNRGSGAFQFGLNFLGRRFKSMFGSMKGVTQDPEKQRTDGLITDKARTSQRKSTNEVGTSGCLGTGLGDLPEPAIASILSLTSPRDVARLACVNRSFRAASESDFVWQMMLPSTSADILAQVANAPASTSTKKEVYDFLCNGVVLRNGTHGYWLHRASGAACRSIGARELFVIWGNDEHYWKWCSKEGARFSEVAYLQYVWWLEVKGRWEGSLPPGTYTFSWRFSLGERNQWHLDEDDIGPVSFSFEATGNEPVNTVCYLTRQGVRKSRNGSTNEGQDRPLGYRSDGGAWMELDVGEFTVESEDSPFEIDFHLKETDCSKAKNDLCIDGVAIRPSFTIQNRIPLSELEVRQHSYVRNGSLRNFRLH